MKRTASAALLTLLLSVAPSRARAEVVVTGSAPLVDTQKAPIASSVDAQAFERLPTARNPYQLLLTLPGTVGDQPVDQVNVAINGGSLSGASGVYVSSGWNWKPSGQGIQLNGPPAGAGGVKVGFNLPKVQRPQPYIDLQFYEKKQQLQKVRLPVHPLAPRQPIVAPKSAIVLPQRLAPGDRIEFRPLDPKFTPGGGDWKIGPWTPRWNGSYDRPSYQFDLPKDFKLTPGFSLRVSYTSPWNEQLVDGTLDGLTFASSPTSPSDAPSVRGCSPAVLDDSPFCVCGNFPAGSAAELEINGAPVGQFLVASSPTILEYVFPPAAPAGAMDLGSSSGFAVADGARGVRIRVSGEIDRAKLKRGESTSLRLWLDGTASATDLRLWNSTPGIVSLAGGDDQVVTTSGGTPNEVTRTVGAVSPGDFALHYELTIDTCPCAGPGESLPALPAADAPDARVEPPTLPNREVFTPRTPAVALPALEPLVADVQLEIWTRNLEEWRATAKAKAGQRQAIRDLIHEMKDWAKTLGQVLQDLKPRLAEFERRIASEPNETTAFERQQVDRYHQLEGIQRSIGWGIFALEFQQGVSLGSK